MYIVVVGAGQEGVSVARIASEAGHNVVVIDAREDRTEAASRELDARVLRASITDAGIGEEAGLDDADALIATTNDDAANLMSAFLAKEAGVERIVSVVNQREHEQLFRHLGVQTLVDPERIVAEHLFSSILGRHFADSLPLPGGASAYDLELGEQSPLANDTVAACAADGRIPQRTVVVAIRRGEEEMIVPAGNTELLGGDRLFLVSASHLPDDRLAAIRGDA